MVKSEAAGLPGDARLLPWSPNTLAAGASADTCHSGLLAQMWLAGCGAGAGAGSLPAHPHLAPRARVPAALCPARARPWTRRPRASVSALRAPAGVRAARAEGEPHARPREPRALVRAFPAAEARGLSEQETRGGRVGLGTSSSASAGRGRRSGSLPTLPTSRRDCEVRLRGGGRASDAAGRAPLRAADARVDTARGRRRGRGSPGTAAHGPDPPAAGRGASGPSVSSLSGDPRGTQALSLQISPLSLPRSLHQIPTQIPPGNADFGPVEKSKTASNFLFLFFFFFFFPFDPGPRD